MNVVEKKRICHAIENALHQTPTSLGRRLRSEEDLAAFFNVGRWTLRSSLDHLVNNGILVRRKGSGTYVQKIPDNGTGTGQSLAALAVSAQKLFADSNEMLGQFAPAFRSSPSPSNLHISLWSGLHHFSTPSNQILLGSITRRLAQTNNHLLLNTMMERPHVMQPIPETSRQLRDNPCDGYLVSADWMESFRDALGDRKVPVLYFAGENFPFAGEPLVTLNTEGTIETAVEVFLSQGCRRIALLGYKGWQKDRVERYQKVYQNAIGQTGLTYEKCLFVEAGKCMNPLSEILQAPDRPDAIYVLDNTLMNEVAAVLNILKLTPGHDISIITFNVAGRSLPGSYEWSQLEFDLEHLGERIVDDLLAMIKSMKIYPSATVIAAVWKPGRTHTRQEISREYESLKERYTDHE